jgi:hypothetical protein
MADDPNKFQESLTGAVKNLQGGPMGMRGKTMGDFTGATPKPAEPKAPEPEQSSVPTTSNAVLRKRAIEAKILEAQTDPPPITPTTDREVKKSMSEAQKPQTPVAPMGKVIEQAPPTEPTDSKGRTVADINRNRLNNNKTPVKTLAEADPDD